MLTFAAASAPSSAQTFISTGRTSSQAGLEVSEEEAAKSDRHPWQADVCAGGSGARMWGPRGARLSPGMCWKVDTQVFVPPLGRHHEEVQGGVPRALRVVLQGLQILLPQPPGSVQIRRGGHDPSHGDSARATPLRVRGLRVPAGWCAFSLVPRASDTEQTPSNPLRMGSEP